MNKSKYKLDIIFDLLENILINNTWLQSTWKNKQNLAYNNQATAFVILFELLHVVRNLTFVIII